jgi:hypothetical protein
MNQTRGLNSPEPRYLSTATTVITLVSLLAGVLATRLIPGLVFTALVMVVAAVIWRIRVLWFWDASYSEIGRDRWIWSSMACAILLLVIFLLLDPFKGDSRDIIIQGSSRVAEVSECMSKHGLSQAYPKFPIDNSSAESPWKPLTGDSASASDPTDPPQPGDPQDHVVLNWCDWPPKYWADADGYTQITITRVQGPDRAAAGNDLAYRVQSPCKKLEIAYTFVHSAIVPAKPFAAGVGSLVTDDGQTWDPTDYKYYSEMMNAFGPHRDEVVVISGSHRALDYAKCIA